MVDGDKITVNGKPLDEFKKDNITVRERRIKDLNAYTFSPRPRSETIDRVLAFGSRDQKPVLGVNTEKNEKGVLITNVNENSAAEKAGLKKGDILTSVGKKAIQDPDDLTHEIQLHKPDDKIEITYLRDGKTANTIATLGQWKTSSYSYDSNLDNMIAEGFQIPQIPAVPKVPGFPNINTWNFATAGQRLGLSVQDMEDGKGAKVVSVQDESAAEKAGLMENDIITEVDGKPVNGADEVAAATKGWKDKTTIKFNVLRDGKSKTIELKVPKRLKTANL